MQVCRYALQKANDRKFESNGQSGTGNSKVNAEGVVAVHKVRQSHLPGQLRVLGCLGLSLVGMVCRGEGNGYAPAVSFCAPF